MRAERRPARLVAAALTAALAATAASGAADAAGATYRVAPSGSRVLVVTRRAGLLSALGHDHAIEGTRVSGAVTWAPDAPAGRRLSGEVVVDASALEIDAPAVRRAAGLGKGPSGDDLAEIRRTLHGPDGLDTSRHPAIRFAVRRVETAPAGSVDPAAITLVEGDLTLHGRTRPVTIPVTVGRSGGRLLVRGRTEIRQRDFGVEPTSVAGGLVRVRDAVEVSLVLLLEE